MKSAFLKRARALGFDIIRITSANSVPGAAEGLRHWLAAGHHGSMEWMAETEARRGSPRGLWPEVNSVIMVGVNYGSDEDPLAHLAHRDRGSIALYARRRDYHDVIKGKLKEAAGHRRAISHANSGSPSVTESSAAMTAWPYAHGTSLQKPVTK